VLHPPRHLHAAALVLLLVLLLHALALDSVRPSLLSSRVAPAASPPKASMQVRQIVPSAGPAARPTTELAAPPARPRALATASPVANPVLSAETRSAVAQAATPDTPRELADPQLLPAATTAIPPYSTSPAPAVSLVFDVRRGLASGQSTLSWRPDNGTYALTLNNEAFGVGALSWASRGLLGAEGLAPERYSEVRNRRELRSTNFQREAGKLSFSAQSHEFPLTAGLQDRLSWMLQLGAVLQANPALSEPGATVTLAVVGTRGAPEPWVFTVQERSAGEPIVHLLREPRRPYDLRVHIWLDPARHHLPVRAQMLVHATGEGHELTLASLAWN
jgi:Protein of unknown function (DUF3108)